MTAIDYYNRWLDARNKHQIYRDKGKGFEHLAEIFYRLAVEWHTHYKAANVDESLAAKAGEYFREWQENRQLAQYCKSVGMVQRANAMYSKAIQAFKAYKSLEKQTIINVKGINARLAFV